MSPKSKAHPDWSVIGKRRCGVAECAEEARIERIRMRPQDHGRVLLIEWRCPKGHRYDSLQQVRP